MAVLGAARVAKVRRLIYAASASACGVAPTLPKSVDMASNPPISWKPPAKPVAMQN
jgi:nucleoside-diphosphate-sugar epimerase